MVIILPFKKKNVRFWPGGVVDNTSLPFYGHSILTPNFASRSSGPFFLFSSINHLLTGISRHVCLRVYFYATNICIWCRPSLYIFCSLIFYIFSIFADLEFKVSLLISLLYTPNKVLPSFCWNLSFDSRSLLII